MNFEGLTNPGLRYPLPVKLLDFESAVNLLSHEQLNAVTEWLSEFEDLEAINEPYVQELGDFSPHREKI